MSSREENMNRFTITDYTDGYAYGGDEDEESSNVQPKSNVLSVVKPPRAVVISRRPQTLEPTAVSSRKEGKQPESNGSGSGSGSGRSISSSGIRPLPRIPSNSISPLEEYPVAGPSTSPITTSPIAVSPTYTFSSQKPAFSPSASAYYTPPPTARTLSCKGKQPDYGNATGTQTRPGRNGSGGSSHYKLQLHEVS